MTIEECTKRLNALAKEVQSKMGNTMVKIASTAVFDIKKRVIETGVNAEGQKFKPYSTTPMLIGSSGFKNKSHASRVFGKQKNKELKWVTLNKLNSEGKKIRLATLPGGYKKFRELNSLQTSHVDFSFNARMWSDIGVISDRSEADKGTVRIGAKAEIEKKKLAGNTERRGTILMLNNKEVKEITDLYGVAIQQSINKVGLG